MATPREAWRLAAEASQTCQPAFCSRLSMFCLAACSADSKVFLPLNVRRMLARGADRFSAVTCAAFILPQALRLATVAEHACSQLSGRGFIPSIDHSLRMSRYVGRDCEWLERP